MKIFVFIVVLACLVGRPLSAGWICVCKPCEQHLGGDSTIGPTATQSECEQWRAKSLANNYPYTPCYEVGGGGSSGSGGDTSLQDATSKALAEGLVHGDSQTFGMGLMGLGAMAVLNSGNQQPSQADIQAQQEEQRRARERAEAARVAEEARKKKWAEGKAEAMGEMKGGDEAAAGQGSDDDMKDLKDDIADKPAKGKKKVKIMHLKPMEDPLHKTPLPEDSTKSDQFDSWEAAKGYPGTTALDNTTGKVVGCPEGYKYYCGGHCWTEAALNDLRIPCDSKLRTDYQGTDLK